MKQIVKNLLAMTKNAMSETDISRNLDKIDASFAAVYQAPAGVEHYRLLTYISRQVSDNVILDVGTYRGYSAVALSNNLNNKVISYDIQKHHTQDNTSNTEYRIGDAIKFEDFNNTSIILLDTFHDGVYEEVFINHLRSIKWKGLLIMDDIKEFPELRVLFDKLPEEKHDISHIGHWSGTGLVIFNSEDQR
jgi:predicted O-methyltransferase YrrM